MPVSVLLETMGAREFEEWRAFDALYPLGSKGEYHRAGIVASSIINCFLRKGAEPIKSDFCLPQYRERQSVEVQMAILDGMVKK